MNIQDFSKAIKDWGESIPTKVKATQTLMTLDAYSLLTTARRSPGVSLYGAPVLSGRYRSSMRISFGAEDGSGDVGPQTIRDAESVSPIPPITAIQQLGAMPAYTKIFITESTPYAGRIEGGYSPKTPQGVFLVTGEYLKAAYGSSAEPGNQRGDW